jgi:hypothetical protein
MGEFKAPAAQQNKTATPVQAPKEASSLGETEYVDSRASTFQFIQLQAAADDQGKGNRITQLQSKSAQFASFSRVAQLQAKRDSQMPSTQSHVVQREENKTGLPDGLKSGMESLSGLSLNDVKVHRNSDKPAQLQAHAYAQGTEIHLGPGQEKHLPHELAHVVQQKEGRVKPTVQMKGNKNVNDNPSLEKEADVMGAKAQNFESTLGTTAQLKNKTISSEVIQGNWFARLFGNKEYQQIKDDDNEVASAGPQGDPKFQASDIEKPEKDEEIKSMGPFTYKGGKVGLDLFGQKLEFTPQDGLVLLDTTYSLGGTPLGTEVDIPIYPGAYATVGLNILPALELKLKGNAKVITEAKEIEMTAAIGGSMSVAVVATAGVKVGVPHLSEVSVGGFGSLKSTANFSGTITGTAGAQSASLNINMEANAALIGTAGVFMQAKVAWLKKKVTYELAKWNFGTFAYQRTLDLSAASKDGWKPVLTDFVATNHSADELPKADDPKAYEKVGLLQDYD